MKTHNQRGYINYKYRAVMLWHKSLGCWILNKIQSNGKIQRDVYGFKNSKAEAITLMRYQYAMKIPQSGWTNIKAQHKGLTLWNDLVKQVWNKSKTQNHENN